MVSGAKRARIGAKCAASRQGRRVEADRSAVRCPERTGAPQHPSFSLSTNTRELISDHRLHSNGSPCSTPQPHNYATTPPRHGTPAQPHATTIPPLLDSPFLKLVGYFSEHASVTFAPQESFLGFIFSACGLSFCLCGLACLHL